MTTTAAHAWLENLLAGHPGLPAKPHAWVNRLRADALERAHSLTLPTVREEEWRFTDLAPLYALAFKPAAPATAPVGLGLEPVIAPEASARLVFIDGQFVPTLSSTPRDGVVVTTLGAALDTHDDLVESQLGRHANFATMRFARSTPHTSPTARWCSHRTIPWGLRRSSSCSQARRPASQSIRAA